MMLACTHSQTIGFKKQQIVCYQMFIKQNAIDAYNNFN